MSTYERVLKVFNTVFEDEIDTSKLSENANLRDDVGINSIGMLYMAMALEEEFNIKFVNEDFAKIATVSDVISVIEEKM